ncbi:MAG: hypothetical protein CMJ78_13465 [Planctomycetaceae bacterium]|nr:hypothetical protein [Planctomycetaceae bacterium]
MPLSSWLRSLCAHSRNSRRSARQNNLHWRSAETQLLRNRRIGPVSEMLEERVLLAAFVVDTSMDVVDAMDGVTSLREAIFDSNASAEADTITFDASLDGTTIALTVTGNEQGGVSNEVGDLDITGDVTITGNGTGNTIVDASATGDRVFHISGGTAVVNISGLTIQGGSATDGGGISNDGNLSLTNVTVGGNTASNNGGGIENNDGAVTLNNVALDGNTANVNGGGLHISGSGNVTVSGGTVNGNIANQEGGGLWNSPGGTLTVNGTTIDGNTANGDDAATVQGGGGIFNVGGTLSISDATITHNVSGATMAGNGGGGGLIEGGSNNTISNTTISDNTANAGSADGGGLWNSGTGSLSVASSDPMDEMAGTLIAGNIAEGDDMATPQGGGGVFNVGGTVTISDAAIVDNVSAATLAGNGGGGILNEGGSLTITDSFIGDNTATDGTADGGGILVAGGMVTIDGSFLGGNAAAQAGGGIEVQAGAGVTITESLLGDTELDPEDPMFDPGNFAGVNGGGLHISSTGSATISD